MSKMRLPIYFFFTAAVCGGLLGGERAFAQDASESTTPVSFYRQLRPILQAKCMGCHQPAKAKGDYIMTSLASLLQGGSEDPVIVPGDPDASYFIEQIVAVDGEAEMPPDDDPLPEVIVDLFRRWVLEGAVDDSPSESSVAYSAENPPVYTRAPVITAIDFSPDGSQVAVSGFHEVLLLNGESLELEARLVGLSERVESVAFSPDGSLLAVTGGSPARMGELQLWDLAKRELALSRLVTSDTIYGASWSPDGTKVAIGGADNTIRAFDVDSGDEILFTQAHDDWAFDTVFSQDGEHLASVGRDGAAKLIEVPTERFIDNITSITPGALRGGIATVDRHPNRDWILFGGADGTPKIYQMFRTTKRVIGDDANLILEAPAMIGRIFDVSFDREGSRAVAVSSLDGMGWVSLMGMDPNHEPTKETKAILQKPTHTRSQAERDALQAYFNDSIELRAVVEVPSTSLYAAAFNPTGERVVVGGADGVLRSIDTSDGSILRSISLIPENSIADASEGKPEATESPSAMAVLNQPEPLPQEPVPAESEVVALRVEPERLELSDPRAYVQLVVSAELNGGATADVTRMVQLEGADGLLSWDETRLIRRDGPGTGALIARFGAHTVSVPVQVGDNVSSASPDYIQDVAPAIARLGCNMGTCHGAKDGKNGFQLSLRGYDPVADIRAFTDDLASRRVNLSAPDQSLMLLKAVAAVPHEGGQRTHEGHDYYEILRQWIADGAPVEFDAPRVVSIEVSPKNPVIDASTGLQQFRVLARYEDGAVRDVTREAFLESGDTEVAEVLEDRPALALAKRRGEAPVLARYEGAYASTRLTVMGDRAEFVWTEPEYNNEIDRLVAAKWARVKTLPADLCDDYTFVRRVTLDLTGLPPSPSEVEAFVADPRPTEAKRAAWIDRLLVSEGFVENWTNKWADMLMVNRKFLGEEGSREFRAWIREQIAGNRPYDEFCQEILTASGSNRETPAAGYYKALREPELIMENTTHLFLATRFNCNKCHDHPFERWTQDNYFEMSAYFARVGLRKDPESGDRKIGGTAVESAKPLYEEVYDREDGEMTHLRTNQEVAPAFPFEAEFDVAEGASRRERLAAWITSPDNRYFASSYVNRIWGYMMGMGIIEPLDDIRAGNPPSNPELLAYLTRRFVESDFNVRELIREIAESRVYQLSVETNRWNADDSINFSKATARRLPAEALYDAIYAVTGAVSRAPGMEPGLRAAALPDAGVRLADGFLANLGRPVREASCECERTNDLQLGPVLALINGPTVGDAIGASGNAIEDLALNVGEDSALIDALYMRILNRPPRTSERAACIELMGSIPSEHDTLVAEMNAYKESIASELEAMARQRLEGIARAEEALASYRAVWEVEEAERQRARLETIGSLTLELDAHMATRGERIADWESGLGQLRARHSIRPLAMGSRLGEVTYTFDEALEAIDARGPEGKDLTTIFFETSDDASVGAVFLEPLPADDLPNDGPGRAPDGNFVLSELDLAWTQLEGPSATDLVKEWSFGETEEGWTASADASIQVSNGQLDVARTGNDPWIALDVDGPSGAFLLEVVVETEEAQPLRLYWKSSGAPQYAEERAISVAAEATGSRYVVYRAHFESSDPLTGLRLDPSDGAGPWRVDSVRWSRLLTEGLTSTPFSKAVADFSQNNFDVSEAVDGKVDGDNGWAISPQGGKAHRARFELEAPVSTPGRKLWRMRLHQEFNGAKFSLGRYRLSWSPSLEDYDGLLPSPIVEILSQDSGSRSASETKVLADYFDAQDPEIERLRAELAAAKSPVAPDEKLLALEAELEEARLPLAEDPELTRLERAVDASANQLDAPRKTAAQDIAWALINSPEFLFNH